MNSERVITRKRTSPGGSFWAGQRPQLQADAAEAPAFPAWMHDAQWSSVLEGSPTIVKRRALTGRAVRELRLIDQTLTLFRVAEVRKLGLAGIFGWRPGYSGIHIRARLVFAAECRLTLDEAKDYILEFLAERTSGLTTDRGFPELSRGIRAARSGTELIGALG